MGESQPEGSRRVLTVGVAAAAALVGSGLGWWFHRRTADPDTAVPQGFWEQQWPGLAGPAVHMADFRGRPILINFWATWCPPCVEELPLINDFYKKNAANGWQVLGLAVDKQEAVESFLARRPLDFTVAMAGMGGAELSRSMGNLAGGLPFSIALAGDGRVLQRKIGKLTEADLGAWAGLK